jgi:dTDP-4-amino-4,6-dideoxygalactose transaminase
MSGTVIPALAPLPPTVWMRRVADELPFPLAEPGCRLFSRARHGLYRALSELVEPGSEILVPAFHHGSEIEAFGRAGHVCRFYEATDDLAPDEAELESLLTPRTRALHLTHYLGFPQDAARWRRWCDERGLLLVEDAAQAWLSTADGRPVGSVGDIAVYCLYKTFGLPDGAALLTRQLTNGALPRGYKGVLWIGLEHALWLATRTRTAAWLSDRRAPRLGTIEYTMGLGDPKLPSGATLAALPRIVDPRAAEQRREHYRRYLELLPGLVVPAFAVLPDGASPFMFPAVFQDKPKALERLRWRRVRALNFWTASHPSVPAGQFPKAMELRRTVVGLPVHQELRPGDVERVAEAVSLAV